jgi:hypothetical protein
MSYPAPRSVIRSTGHARERSIPWAVLFGGALILAGLVLVVVAVSARDDSPWFAIGGLAVGGGVLRLTTALTADARRRRKHPVDPDDPRWHGGSGGVQLAGRTCVECERKIVIGTDARSCKECAAPTHIDCEEQHRARAHAPDTVGPFR